MKVVLERYHGLGNDYVVFDPNKNEFELTPENVKMICDRNAVLALMVCWRTDSERRRMYVKYGTRMEVNRRQVVMEFVFSPSI